MKSTISQLALITLALSAAQQAFCAFDPPRPCVFYSQEVSKLKACPTARAFCSSLIGTASFTRPVTASRTVPAATITQTRITTTNTNTVYTTTVFVEDTTTDTVSTVSASTTTSVQTVPFYGLSCPTNNAVAKRGTFLSPAIDARAAAAPSCGIITTNRKRIDGACNCILASSSAVATQTVRSGTKTVVRRRATVTTVSTQSTATTVATTTVYTSTSVTTAIGPTCTACCPRFLLQITGTTDARYANKYLLGGPGDGTIIDRYTSERRNGTVFAFTPTDDAIKPGVLIQLQGDNFRAEIQDPQLPQRVFFFRPRKSDNTHTLTCRLSDPDGLQCTAPASFDASNTDPGVPVRFYVDGFSMTLAVATAVPSGGISIGLYPHCYGSPFGGCGSNGGPV